LKDDLEPVGLEALVFNDLGRVRNVQSKSHFGSVQ